MSPSPFPPAPPRVSAFNRAVVEEFRANAGRVGGPFEGGDLLLLTTRGARTGQEQTCPLGYVRDEDGGLLVVASAGGAPRNPAWYHNLLAHPAVRVEVGAEAYGAVAVPTGGAERARLFAHVVRHAPGYADYQARVERPLPVVRLERLVPEAPFTGLVDKLLEIHAWLRDQLRHVADEAEAYFAARRTAPHAPPPLGLQLRQHCLAFCEGLHTHHTSEDQGAFPALAEKYPGLAPALARLRDEHRTVDRIRGELEDLLSCLAARGHEPGPGTGTGTGAGHGHGSGAVPGAERFRAELARMTRELEAHLDYEEEVPLPPLSALPVP
ncbi:nitroreductase family deazaflavin-dependent oxidoreductase [Streptomyces albus subsp. chlorinus]|uniref:nitroreductase/quinone reductase family protein n=1 Tax=Streptomyces albus TaxID=1888 RepID=UPI00156D54AB|nr:nitroreductase/quinone reductase family protein [Streptomyces albus]NSC22120.1 nitroreductase family deazaflavin-dependent oxidoreductase [Streptomyces albus subsp. chlorinus]